MRHVIVPGTGYHCKVAPPEGKFLKKFFSDFCLYYCTRARYCTVHSINNIWCVTLYTEDMVPMHTTNTVEVLSLAGLRNFNYLPSHDLLSQVSSVTYVNSVPRKATKKRPPRLIQTDHCAGYPKQTNQNMASFVLKWGKKDFQVTIDGTTTPLSLMKEVEQLTGVVVANQKIMAKKG